MSSAAPAIPAAHKLPPDLQVKAWNDHHPVGTPVVYWPGTTDGPARVGVTTSPAWYMGGHAAVVKVRGYAGGIALTHVRPVHAEHRSAVRLGGEVDTPDGLTLHCVLCGEVDTWDDDACCTTCGRDLYVRVAAVMVPIRLDADLEKIATDLREAAGDLPISHQPDALLSLADQVAELALQVRS